MPKPFPKHLIVPFIALGSVWGLSETALGLGIQKCASYVSGSLMTGVALFFIAAAWASYRHFLGIVLVVLVASLFKLFDALLLSLPVLHGAVANPIFAFFLEGLALFILVMVFKKGFLEKKKGQAALGGTSALLAVGLFPLVKFATGIPACVYPGTGIPLSVYYGPLAVVLSILTVPLGFLAAEKIQSAAEASSREPGRKAISRILYPAAVALCLLLAALVRVV